jgi:hypothetical protein
MDKNMETFVRAYFKVRNRKDEHPETYKTNNEKYDNKRLVKRDNTEVVGKYDMPLIKAENISVNEIDLLVYTKAKLGDNYKTQTLTRIKAICPSCHGVIHFKNSTRIGYGEQAKAHFMKVNNCNLTDFTIAYIEAENRFDSLSKIDKWNIAAPLLDELGIKYK